jgi:hypothetical protein
VLAFESGDGLARVMTGERYRLLRHLHKHPEPSVSALARALGRQYRRVHADVAALEQAACSTARAALFGRPPTDPWGYNQITWIGAPAPPRHAGHRTTVPQLNPKA